MNKQMSGAGIPAPITRRGTGAETPEGNSR